MTGEQKQCIQDMRIKGSTYSQIADILGLSANTVKSFCHRINRSNACDAFEDTGNEENKEHCKQCGKKLIFKEKTKPKRFCCDKCRFDWWNANRDKSNRKTADIICTHCKKRFDGYGNKSRKYCSHHCYILERFSTNKEVCAV